MVSVEVLADVSAGILGIRFQQQHKLLVDSRRLQLIGPSLGIKLTGFETITGAHRITCIFHDIPNNFQSLFIKFSY